MPYKITRIVNQSRYPLNDDGDELFIKFNINRDLDIIKNNKFQSGDSFHFEVSQLLNKLGEEISPIKDNFSFKLVKSIQYWETKLILPKKLSLDYCVEPGMGLNLTLQTVSTKREGKQLFVPIYSRSDVKGEYEITPKVVVYEAYVSLNSKTIDSFKELQNSASFLKLDNCWFEATCALQLQETAIKLVAKKRGIKLDKRNIENILNKKIENKFVSFTEQYNAFCKKIKSVDKIKMPFLTTDLRKMRSRVLHDGYNPLPMEVNTIVTFTIGLLKKLDTIYRENKK